MRAVNLARRPFVNRRPILRLAVLLWLVGAAFLLLNMRLFTGHFKGTAQYRDRLIAVDAEVDEARARLQERDAELARVNLAVENGKTKFLNSLIAYRKFPWSALFDDLEEVVPLDVRLVSVKPAVQLVAEPEKPRRRRRRNSASSRAANRDGQSGAQETREAVSNDKSSEEKLRRNEVLLDLVGVARTEDALVEFIDTLYANPSFRDPFLPGESFQAGSTNFSISVVYLTRTADEMEPATENGEGLSTEVAAQTPEGEAVEGGAQGLGTAGSLAAPGAAAPGGAQTAASQAAGGLAPAGGVGTGNVAAGSTTPGSTTSGGAASGGAASSGGATAEGADSGGPATERPGRARRGNVLPGGVAAGGVASGAASSGSSLPGAESQPTTTQPGFATPPASATPALQSGSLLGEPVTAKEALA